MLKKNFDGFTQSQLREYAYNNDVVITWKDTLLTVDEATKKWLYYLSGDDTVNADALKALIVPAREAIKLEIPND